MAADVPELALGVPVGRPSSCRTKVQYRVLWETLTLPSMHAQGAVKYLKITKEVV